MPQREFRESAVRERLDILSRSRLTVRPAARSASASSAIAFSMSWDCANLRVHPSSDASADCSHPAIRSCSSWGRDDIWEKTVSSARVTVQRYYKASARACAMASSREIEVLGPGTWRG